MNILRSVGSENGADLAERLLPRPVLGAIPCIPQILRPHDVLEIRGGPKSGKSLYLGHMIAHFLMANPGSEIVVVNTDYDIESTLMRDILGTVSSRSEASHTDTVEGCLNRLLILRTFDQEEFKIVFSQFSDMLAERPDIAALIIDSLGSFYYVERLSSRVHSYDAYVQAALHRVRQSLGGTQIPIVYIKPEIFPQSTRRDNGSRRDGGPTKVLEMKTVDGAPRSSKLCVWTDTTRHFIARYHLVIRNFDDINIEIVGKDG